MTKVSKVVSWPEWKRLLRMNSASFIFKICKGDKFSYYKDYRLSGRYLGDEKMRVNLKLNHWMGDNKYSDYVNRDGVFSVFDESKYNPASIYDLTSWDVESK